ncbi:hypothetical protein TNCV_3021631 [Trichonephila clavipes]|nr:hypothetical protein TNCV_3021631 [Trichonephila clavipes]
MKLATNKSATNGAILLTKTDVYTYNTVFTVRLSPRAESDLRVSLLDNGLVGPYSDTVLVTSFSPGSSTCASRVRSLNSDLHNNTEPLAKNLENIKAVLSRFKTGANDPKASTRAENERLKLDPLAGDKNRSFFRAARHKVTPVPLSFYDNIIQRTFVRCSGKTALRGILWTEQLL